MNRLILYIILLCLIGGQVQADIYIIIYATYNGQSGHAGIAIDQYEIKIYNDNSRPKGIRVDTIATGNLIYYDLWPKSKHFNKELVTKNVEASVYRLPCSTAEKDITIHSLLKYGIPHQKGYPVDGILKIKLGPANSYALQKEMDNIASTKFYFNAIHFNCVDFVQLALDKVLTNKVNAKEEILFVKASTPNKLYQALSRRKDVIVIKDPGPKILGTFLEEKIMKIDQS